MKYLLDTNICVYWLKGNRSVEQKVLETGTDNIFISFITLSELYYGVYKSQKVEENLSALLSLESKLRVIESDSQVSETFGKLKAELQKKGRMIDDADLFIAACALANKLILVTNNEKHFQRIKSLSIENWIKES